MKIYKNILYPLILILSAVLFISCDLLFPAPLGRDNPLDDQVQIGGFKADASGPDSIITSWDWRNPAPGIDDSRIIDKIRIVYSENSPPSSKYPLDPDKLQKFDSPSGVKCEWTNLNSDEEHYFALYAHESGGVWLAPKTVKVWIDNSGQIDFMAPGYELMYVSTTNGSQVINGTTIVDSASFGFIKFFDNSFNDQYGAMLNISLAFTSTNAGEMYIVPVYREINTGLLWEDISNPLFYDYTHAKAVLLIGGAESIVITDLVELSRVTNSLTLAFIFPPTSLGRMDLNIGTLWFDDFTYWRNWW